MAEDSSKRLREDSQAGLSKRPRTSAATKTAVVEDLDAEWALFKAAVGDDEEPVAVDKEAAQEGLEDQSSPALNNPPGKALNRYEEMKLEQGEWMERLESLRTQRRSEIKTASSPTKTSYRPVSSLVDVQDIQIIPFNTLQERLLHQPLSDRRRNRHVPLLLEDPTVSESSGDDDEK